MDDNRLDEVKDVRWESAECSKGEINFTSRRRKSRIKKLLNGLVFVLIAAISGGASGAYVISKKYPNNYSSINQPSLEPKKEVNKVETADIPKNAITKVAEVVGPTVVGISNRAEGFFGLQDLGGGSGIIFDSNGYIVTNNHVVEGAAKVTVKLSSGKTLPATIVGTDSRSDLAVIKVDAQNLPTAKLGDSSKVKVGDIAIAIGNPLGEEFSGSVTAGIVSALNRRIQYAGAIYKVLQTDAAINPGNSGGPLCNEAGEIIGINSLKMGSDQNAEGMGFAISINEAKDIIKSLMDYGKVARPFLGIYGQGVVSEKNNIKGIYVREVVQGSGAALAGVKPTDIILELDGKKVTKFEDLADILDKHKIGDLVVCKIWRSGETIEVNITLSDVREKSK
ncbi:trypsin-like peptidase domain-containing protein [Clostridium sp. CX1]|uniref:Trypsin-like peptidase domain-containing protein n=1 Tax=Clostridium tanneri TaxID=3037988 RepID=A0ABU4JU36_9CLOT|nr:MULTISPECIES: trypsin-like peptidase domain-containing protein [unclassified Clostridium]MCT8977495.1 trypsin-like peptidase domain-containing protein [Clostridium sp. CX1]MDW8801671.1 trypsin-like peptidase domain-containing protein [Clostridium sp. A1-XYC3]